LGHHLPVEPFEVLGFELIESVRADAGDEMDADGAVVGVPGVLGYRRRSDDGIQPVVQPLFDRPCLPGLADLALIASPFQVANFFGDRLWGSVMRCSGLTCAVVC
jgi:hypothetical protein